MFKRIALFLATNLAVMVLLGVVLTVLQRVFGVTLGNTGTLLVFAAVFGFGGAFISLAISKWIAKRSMGLRIITEPRNEGEAWLRPIVNSLLLVILAILLLTSGETNAVDRLALLGWVALIGGAVLLFLAWRAYNRPRAG